MPVISDLLLRCAVAVNLDYDSMMPEGDYRNLLRGTLVAIALCFAAVLVCYFWIDRPVAFFVEHHQINKLQVFRWLTYPPPEVQTWSPLVLSVLIVRRAWGPFAHWQKALLVACISLIMGDQFRASLGDVFGRYWPETWFNNNPSLIGTGTYGFHPFQRGDELGSFPSGHAARIVSFAAVWWIAMPGGRPICIVVSAPMLVSLVATNYHFLSDVIAGCVLGAIVAAYAARLARLQFTSEEYQRSL
jgi:membrane-associated phospholipid phosphatase